MDLQTDVDKNPSRLVREGNRAEIDQGLLWQDNPSSSVRRLRRISEK
jgi:hypothetical protein